MSKKKDDMQLYKKIPSLDYKLGEKLLHLYIGRCKIRHALAFMEYRKFLPGANVDNLNCIFEDRKAFLIRLLKKV